MNMRYKKNRGSASAALAFVTWGMLALAVVGGAGLFVYMLNESQSAVHEAAAGSMVSTFFIGAYVLARCVEKMIKAFSGE